MTAVATTHAIPSADLLQLALLRANPRLSRFNPLPRILAFDDFDEGVNGWTELIGNHDGDLDHVSPNKRDFRPPQISSCTFFDVGTHGAMDGTYALKLATRARPDHMAVAIKRLTLAAPGRVQLEMYFTYKAEATVPYGPNDDATGAAGSWDGNTHPSEAQFGDFTISNDVCARRDGVRWMSALRYVNAGPEGRLVQRWMAKTSVQATTKMQLQGITGADVHTLRPEDWVDVPGGDQALCFNEVPTKVNWHYLRWMFDTQERRNVVLQVNEHTMDLADVPVAAYDDRYEALDGLLNFVLDVRTRCGVRNFLYVDSALISVDW